MLPLSAVSALPERLRFLVIDASTVQAPGAKGIDHRLHIAMDLVSLEFIEVLISDVHTGETLKHFTWLQAMLPWLTAVMLRCRG
jgi:hypothetical protein